MPISHRNSDRRAGWRDLMAALPILGLLVGAGAAKSGYGHWAVGAVAMSVPAYFGAVASVLLTRTLARRVTRIQSYAGVALPVSRPRTVAADHSHKHVPRPRHAGRAALPCMCWKRAA